MSLIIPANTLASGGYAVDNSCRFNAGSSDYLSRTFGSGNQKTWTWSAWIKLANIDSTSEVIFGRLTADDDSNWFTIDIRGNDKITIGIYNTNYLITNRLFRDVSAWYHIVVAFDTTQSTADNRVRLYVNGLEETSFATRNNPSLNFDAPLNANVEHLLGKSYSTYYEGYMSEVTFIDGQQLDPTSFGEFDEDSGIWKPIDVSGLTFGTNGFYLDFEDSAALGDDVSGNGNDFTVNNLTAIDQTTDTPTNNFATLNPLTASVSAITYSEGNLALSTSTTWTATIATMASSLGKWYWEFKMGANTTMLGVSDVDRNINVTYNHQQSGTVFYYNNNGNKYVDGAASAYGATYTTNDIIGVALDLDSGTPTVTFYKNGTTQGTINLPSSMLGKSIVPIVELQSGIKYINFGNPPYAISSGNTDGNGYGNFEYAVPSGYYSLNSKNLSEFG